MAASFNFFSVREGAYKNFAELFSLSNNSQICKAVIVSAYIDSESVDQLLKLMRNKKYAQGRTTLQLFVDRAPIRSDMYDRLLKANRELKSQYSAESGIYLVSLGKLFHCKCYLIEGRTRGQVLIGSMNFTQNGLKENEECLFTGEYAIGSRTAAGRLANSISDYAARLIASQSARIIAKKEEVNLKRNLRELLLDGWLFHEVKEQNPLYFKMNLPEEAKSIRNALPFMDGSIADSMPLSKLRLPGELPGDRAPEDKAPKRSQWKDYCLETCYGYWTPGCFKATVETEINKLNRRRRPYLKRIIMKLENHPEKFEQAFLEAVEAISQELQNQGVSNWIYGDSIKAVQDWRNRCRIILSKLNYEAYFDKVISGINRVPVPDVWGDQLAGLDFENSFCDAILYAWSKRGDRNKLARKMAANSRLADIADDAGDLRDKLAQWLDQYPDGNLFE